MDNIKDVNEITEESLTDSEKDLMMSEYEKTFIRLNAGDIVKGKVIYVTDEEASVDIGYKADGIISRSETSVDGSISPKDILKPGDEIAVYVVKVNDGDGNVLLSKKRVDVEKSWDFIDKCYRDRTKIEAKVTQLVKGGLTASVKGIRVFIPASQVDIRYNADLSVFAGKTIEIYIIEYDSDKRRVIGSRRAVLEEEMESRKKEVLESIGEGQVLQGRVMRLTDFGAFVDLGGVDGLIHISELSWSRVKHPSEVVKVGDTVEVYVLSVDKEKSKISLSLKKTIPEPWNNIEDRIHVGDMIHGKVAKIAPFGAFVQIEPGVDGLVHISQISEERVNKIDSVLKVGETVKVKVLDIKAEDKKLSLSIKEANESEE